MGFNIVFGDIHGCPKAAKKAIEIAESKNIQAIFLGDYIDRGPDSVETLYELIKAKKRNPIKESNYINSHEVEQFLDELFLFYEDSSFIYVHAVLNNNLIPLISKDKELLLWNYNTQPEWTIKQFIHGHDRVNQILYHGKGININTSCGFGGFLTGVVVDVNNSNIVEVINLNEEGNVF